MILELNTPQESLNLLVDGVNIDGIQIKKYREFFGRNVDTLPKAKGIKRKVLSLADIQERRYDTRDSEDAQVQDVSTEVRNSWMNNYFHTSDFPIYASKEQEGKIKFVSMYDNQGNLTKDGELVLQVIDDPQFKLVDGAKKLTEELYDRFQGVREVTRKELGKLDSGLTEFKAKDSLFWKIGLRHSNEVPPEYARSDLHTNIIPFIFSQVEQKLKDNTAMRVYLDSTSDYPKLRALCVSRLGGRSSVNGRGNRADDGGRFVGLLAPEALDTKSMQVKAYTDNDLKTAKDEYATLLEHTRPERIGHIGLLLKKL